MVAIVRCATRARGTHGLWRSFFQSISMAEAGVRATCWDCVKLAREDEVTDVLIRAAGYKVPPRGDTPLLCNACTAKAAKPVCHRCVDMPDELEILEAHGFLRQGERETRCRNGKDPLCDLCLAQAVAIADPTACRDCVQLAEAAVNALIAAAGEQPSKVPAFCAACVDKAKAPTERGNPTAPQKRVKPTDVPAEGALELVPDTEHADHGSAAAAKKDHDLEALLHGDLVWSSELALPDATVAKVNIYVTSHASCVQCSKAFPLPLEYSQGGPVCPACSAPQDVAAGVALATRRLFVKGLVDAVHVDRLRSEPLGLAEMRTAVLRKYPELVDLATKHLSTETRKVYERTIPTLAEAAGRELEAVIYEERERWRMATIATLTQRQAEIAQQIAALSRD